MLSDAFHLAFLLYAAFLTQPKTMAVLALIAGFLLVASVVGLANRVFSRAAIRNTVTSLGVLAGNILLSPLVFFAGDALTRLHARWGWGDALSPVWQGLPFWVTLAGAVILKDLADYWSHRVLHMRLLWPVHAVHHSDTHVNGFTTFRVHVLELVVMSAFYLVFLTALGVPAEAIALAFVITGLHNAYVHFEVDIDHGKLNWLLASPRFHRWHHADVPEAYGKNLANMIPLWDILFGTLYSAGRCDARMGAERDGIPGDDAARLFFLPLRLWYRSLREAIASVTRASRSAKS